MPSRFQELALAKVVPTIERFFAPRGSDGEFSPLVYQPPGDNPAIELVGWLVDDIAVRSEEDPRNAEWKKVETRTIHGRTSQLTVAGINHIQAKARVTFVVPPPGVIIPQGMGMEWLITQGYGISGEEWAVDLEASRWDELMVTIGLMRAPLVEMDTKRNGSI